MSATPGTTALKPIKVVPHFSRLHEWIALEEGYFEAEGLDPVMLPDVMHSVSSHPGHDYRERPQDLPFVSDTQVANSACHWGSACNAGAGMGRFVPDLYTVGRYAMFAGPGSDVEMLCQLRDRPVGIGEMAGSHFTSLNALGQVIPREHLNRAGACRRCSRTRSRPPTCWTLRSRSRTPRGSAGLRTANS
jgi:hypothetical protein